MNKVLAGHRILVVEDDPKSLDIAVKLLQHYGANTFAAMNGIEGLAFTQAYKPDLIISDLSMPGMSGWMMIKELKQDVVTQEIPVVVMSAHDMPRNIRKAEEIGCNKFLSKPLNPLSFVEDIVSVLGQPTR